MWSDVPSNCSPSLNCSILQEELAERDIIAILRTILSSLSVLGTFTIIVSVLRRKQACSPKIHPIFMLSIADFLLAALWMAGGGIWLSSDPYHFSFNRKNCFIILLATVIVECVTINLTCIYALLAYSSIRQRDFSNVYTLLEKDANNQVWRPWKTVLVYLLAWLEPVVVILVPFAIVDWKHGMVQNADDCTCWCVPYFGNLKPHTVSNSEARALYLYGLGVYVLVYSVIVAAHYIVGFLLLSVVYLAVLARIKHLRTVHKHMTNNSNMFGATEAILVKGQSEAKARVIYFLTVFISCSFFNLLLAAILVHYSSDLVNLYHQESEPLMRPYDHSHHVIPLYVMITYLLQSITVPLQGFLNAIVYGWTRKDFVKAVDNSLSYRVPPPLVPPKPRRSLLFRRKQQQEQEQEKVGESYAQESSQLLNSPRRTQDRERRNLRDHLNVLSDNSDSDGSL